MARLIDADALKKQIEDFNCKDCNNYNFVRCRACHIDDAISYLDDAPTVGGWISVKDRLPEDYIKVLVAVTDVAGTFVAVVWREDNNWNDGEGGWPNEDVTHWMPFPEPPKEEKQWQNIM